MEYLRCFEITIAKITNKSSINKTFILEDGESVSDTLARFLKWCQINTPDAFNNALMKYKALEPEED